MKLKKLRWMIQGLGLILTNLGIILNFKIGIVYPYLYCYACPLSYLGCPFGVLQNMAIMRVIPFLTLGLLGALYTVLGRFFCGWICPIGLLTRTFETARRWIYKKSGKSQRTPKLPKKYSYTKYGILVGSLIIAFLLGDTYFCKYCIAGFVTAGIPYRLKLHQSLIAGLTLEHPFTLHIAIFVLIAIVSIAYNGKTWCRYICPIGALAGTFNNVSMLKLSYDPSKCTNCLLCLNACPMSLDPRNLDSLHQTDCIRCGNCIDACPTKALYFAFTAS